MGNIMVPMVNFRSKAIFIGHKDDESLKKLSLRKALHQVFDASLLA